jgi:diaminopimelate epimerase
VAAVTVEFWKYEGTANDFVVLELDDPRADLDPALVARLCDRHRGIGADGVLLVTPSSLGLSGRMVVRNADGSRPEMCGNGLRCVALHLAGRRGGAAALEIETDAGPRACRVDARNEAGADVDGFVTIDMGVLRVGEPLIVPFRQGSIALVPVDAGNPHAVAFEGLAEEDLDELGARLQASAPFPRGVNLERVVVGPGPAPSAQVSVFERGVGRTMACGTGACAVAAAMVARGLGKVGETVTVVLPGGPLEIVLSADGRASMRGPARRVFSGRIALPATGRA